MWRGWAWASLPAGLGATAAGERLAEGGGWLAPLGFLLGVAGPAVLLLLPGLGLAAVRTRGRAAAVPEAVALVMVGSGVAFAAVFWAYLWSPQAGHAAALAAAVGGTALWSTNVRGPERAFLPFALGAAVAAVTASLAFSAGGVPGGDLTVAERYWVAPDNRIPALVGVRLVDGESTRASTILPGWRMTDRPPLQVGATTGLLPLFADDFLGYQLAATALQAWWVPALLAVLLALGWDRRTAFTSVPLAATTGVVFFNTLYVWPKLLAGAIVLAGVAAARAPGRRPAPWVLVATAALGMLAHGGVVFALPACAWVAREAFRGRSWPSLAVAVAVGLALYAPWIACQRLYDPPGDRLLRWHLAADLRETAPPFTEVLVDSYRMPVGELVKAKARNVAALTATPWLWEDNPGTPAWKDIRGRIRNATTLHLLLAPGFLLAGLVALRRDRRARVLFGLTAGTALASVVLEHGGLWSAAAHTPHLSHVPVVTWAAAGAVGTLALAGRTRRIVVVAHAAGFAALWLFLGRASALTTDAGYHVHAAAWTAAVLGAGAVALLVHVGRRPEPSAVPVSRRRGSLRRL